MTQHKPSGEPADGFTYVMHLVVFQYQGTGQGHALPKKCDRTTGLTRFGNTSLPLFTCAITVDICAFYVSTTTLAVSMYPILLRLPPSPPFPANPAQHLEYQHQNIPILGHHCKNVFPMYRVPHGRKSDRSTSRKKVSTL